jgi:catechol 2,3-dioxygenase-like lactoylglutathione lyase family enzyme
MQGVRLDHATINTADVDATVEFYGTYLGLQAGYRPDFGVPGAWLHPEDDDYPIVHVMGVSEIAESAGNIEHLAFRGRDLQDYLRKLKANNAVFTAVEVDGTPFTQVQHFDPNGVKIEITFEEKASAS